MARDSRGWFRRKKNKLVYCWIVADAETGQSRERSLVIGPDFMSNDEGRETVGVLKKEGKIRMDDIIRTDQITFSDLAAYYFANKEFMKKSTKDHYEQIISGVLVPRWGKRIAVGIRPVEVKHWLKALNLENPTRAKYRSVMGAVYTFAQSEGFIPLGLENNPLHYVKGFSAVSDYESITLEPEQTYNVLEQLQQPEYTLLLLIAATGLRQSEALGLCWDCVLWGKGEIRIRQAYVHGNMQDGAKTRASKSSVMMHPLLAEVMKAWQTATLYGKPEDYVFASHKLSGRKPRTGSIIVEDYLRPAAIKAKVISLDAQGQTFDLEGNKIKRFGFHVFRHSLCSFLMAEGENPAVIQATLRHTRLDMTMYYAHSRKKQKLEAQGRVLEAVLRGERGLQRGPEAIQ
jgi:integrase